MNKNKKIQLALIFLLIFGSTVFANNNTPTKIKKNVSANSIERIEDKIILDVIGHIESSHNALAENKDSGARGYYQITKICLKEYNNFHKVKYSYDDLFNKDINEKIASWYLYKRIPQMLKYFKKDINIENVLICYNAGINYVVKNKKLKNETKNYIKSYYDILWHYE